MARSSVLVSAIGFDPNEAMLLGRLAERCNANEVEFKGPFNLWLHFDKLPHAEALGEVKKGAASLVENPGAHFMF